MPRKRAYDHRRSSVLRRLAFVALFIAIVGAAIYLVRPKDLREVEEAMASGRSAVPGATAPRAGPTQPADLSIRIDMAGFTPPNLDLPAGRDVRLRLVNPDNSHHTDGGGVHGFTVPGLGIDTKVPPESTKVITIPASVPGDYAFYCDTCCGGKENPSMQGFIRVRA